VESIKKGNKFFKKKKRKDTMIIAGELRKLAEGGKQPTAHTHTEKKK
jgi:hypothetical protein